MCRVSIVTLTMLATRASPKHFESHICRRGSRHKYRLVAANKVACDVGDQARGKTWLNRHRKICNCMSAIFARATEQRVGIEREVHVSELQWPFCATMIMCTSIHAALLNARNLKLRLQKGFAEHRRAARSLNHKAMSTIESSHAICKPSQTWSLQNSRTHHRI